MTEPERLLIAAAAAWWKDCGRLGPRMDEEDGPLGVLASKVESYLKDIGEADENGWLK